MKGIKGTRVTQKDVNMVPGTGGGASSPPSVPMDKGKAVTPKGRETGKNTRDASRPAHDGVSGSRGSGY